MVPHAREIIAADAQEAHNEATRLANQPSHDNVKAIVHSVEPLGIIQTEEIDYDYPA